MGCHSPAVLYNLATVRSLTWNYAESVPLASATATELADFLAKLNVCSSRLLTMGKWRGTRQRANLPILDGKITLPRYLESCLGVNLQDCLLSPRLLYSMYAPFQIALDDGWNTGVIPISETAQTFIIPEEGFKLKAVSFAAGDNGKFVKLINGTDSSGDPIYATESLTLNNGAPPTSTTIWNTLPVIQKDVTTGGVELYSVIGSTEELIAVYAPSETIPAYKQYQVNNPGDLTSCSALCKLSFVPASADTDLIFPSVLGALIKGLQAVVYELNSDDRDAARWAAALKILEDDRQELDGKNMPVVEFVGDFGAGQTPNLVGDQWSAYPYQPYY